MNILDKIIQHKRLEVTQHRISAPMQELQSSEFFYRPCLSLKHALARQDGTGIIAEFKRQSPSKGVINAAADVVEVTGAYAESAAGLSVLTDKHFFGGSNEDLIRARVHHVPILRKDFIVDEYQIAEAKSIGADVILLIAACLEVDDVRRLAAFAKNIGMEVLLEIHNQQEIGHICGDCDIVGVNNRDLKTFTVDVNRSIQLSDEIPADKIKISESGISNVDTIHTLRRSGFKGFLIGENFMKEEDPAIAYTAFVNRLKLTTREGYEN